mmetsp:Transcript_4279/g.4815  ORF Transcript_4279/g.4815 Transcript_4279/m.4815 type:complete len:124 (+) Transcript_4279:2-373(+)
MTGKKQPQPPTVTPVDGILLADDGESLMLDGHIMHVDANGCLDMGEVDHLFGASPAVVAALPRHTLDSTASLGERTVCTICQSEFQCGETLVTLPCLHHYHEGCILPWLKVSKKCPLCEDPVG